MTESEECRDARAEMVEQQLRQRDITDERVLAAMLKVPRHEFVGLHQIDYAYSDSPLSIGHGQTISQPYIVALMSQLARPQPTDRALEIGTGCGYQTAVLSRLVKSIVSLEIVPQLAESARERMSELGIENVQIHLCDGTHGRAEEGPFDIILAAAAPRRVPTELRSQLASGGRLIIPVGVGTQSLMRITREQDGTFREEQICAVAFVPMTGDALS